MLAWRRLRADRLAMVSLAVVAAYLLMIALSGSGLIAADWDREVGVNYAPPAFADSADGDGCEDDAGCMRRRCRHRPGDQAGPKRWTARYAISSWVFATARLAGRCEAGTG